MRSLFIVSLPRSLSSHCQIMARQLLGLADPAWTSHGEILNGDRFNSYAAPVEFAHMKYITRPRAPEAFEHLVAMLERAVVAEGFAYKDVIQPFAVSHWIEARGFAGAAEKIAVLKIVPDLAHVAYSMFALRGWTYPQHATRLRGDDLTCSIDGLLRAERALKALPGESVGFAEMLQGEAPLCEALRRLYPKADVPSFTYSERFRAGTREILERREQAEYRALAERIEALRFEPAPQGGLTVRFGAADLGRHWLWKGWAPAEEWGSWSDGDAAEMVVPLTRPVRGEARLDLRVRAHAGAPPGHSVRIACKGRVVACAAFTRGEDDGIALRVPAELVDGDDALVLDFAFPDAAAPAGEREARKRAIGLISATLSY